MERLKVIDFVMLSRKICNMIMVVVLMAVESHDIAQTILVSSQPYHSHGCLNMKNESFFIILLPLGPPFLWVLCKTGLIGSHLKKIEQSGDGISP